MSAQSGLTTPPPSVSYAQLRAWIDSQEAYERLHGRPAPLTVEQRLAIAAIVPPPLAPPSPPSPASRPLLQPRPQPSPPQPSLPGPPAAMIENPDFDWVSLLSRYSQAQQRYSPGNIPEYVEEAVTTIVAGVQHWCVRCTLPREAPGQRFPGDEESSTDVAKIRKKDAKQYAARRAVEYLMAHRHMPCDGVSVSFPKAPPVSPLAAMRAAPLVRPASAASASSASAPAPASASASASSSPPPSPPQPAAVFAVPVAQPAPETSIATSAPKGKGKQRAAPVRSASQLTSPVPSSSVDIVSPLPKNKSTTRSMASYRHMAPKAAPSSSQQRLGHNSSSTTTNVDDSDSEEEVSNVKQLEQFCDNMKMARPKLEVLSSPNFAGIFNGRVVFVAKKDQAGNSNVSLPPEVGSVKNVYTRKAAKEQLAGNVLSYLQRAVGQSET